MLPHELDDVAEAKAGGGVLAGSKRRSGPDLETGDALEVLRKEPGIAGDHKVVADPEMERGRFALEKFPDPTLESDLEFAKGKNLGGVDLQDGRLAWAVATATEPISKAASPTPRIGGKRVSRESNSPNNDRPRIALSSFMQDANRSDAQASTFGDEQGPDMLTHPGDSVSGSAAIYSGEG